MIQKGLLDKHGKPNGSTPQDWKSQYVDYRCVGVKAGPVGVGCGDGGMLQTVIPQRLAVPSEGVSLQQEPSGRSFSTRPLAEPQLHLQTVTKQGAL